MGIFSTLFSSDYKPKDFKDNALSKILEMSPDKLNEKILNDPEYVNLSQETKNAIEMLLDLKKKDKMVIFKKCYESKRGTRPASAGPASAGPASAGPASARPASARPASARPASAGPASARLVLARPASMRPMQEKPAAIVHPDPFKPEADAKPIAKQNGGGRRRRRRTGRKSKTGRRAHKTRRR